MRIVEGSLHRFDGSFRTNIMLIEVARFERSAARSNIEIAEGLARRNFSHGSGNRCVSTWINHAINVHMLTRLSNTRFGHNTVYAIWRTGPWSWGTLLFVGSVCVCVCVCGTTLAKALHQNLSVIFGDSAITRLSDKQFWLWFQCLLIFVCYAAHHVNRSELVPSTEKA